MNMLKAAAIAAVLSTVALAGCQTIPTAINNPLTISNLAPAEATYGIAQAAAAQYVQRYRDGKRCTTAAPASATNLCSARSVVLKLQAADRKAMAAIHYANAFIVQHPTIDPSAVIQAATDAVSAFYSLAKGVS